MSIYSIIGCIPKMYDITITIEQACSYVEKNSEKRIKEMQPIIKAGLESLSGKAIELFGTLDNKIQIEIKKLCKHPSSSNYVSWLASYWGFIINKSYVEFVKCFQDKSVSFQQCTKIEIDQFCNILKRFNLPKEDYAQFLLIFSELCSTSEPETSCDLILQAFCLNSKIVEVPHLENYCFTNKVIEEQKHLEKCPVCNGKGTPYHTGPAYLMNSFQSDFLPAKLWMKCECCGNLYTRYFPKKFFNRKNQLKVITPHQNIEQKLASDVSVTILRTWCDMLQNMKQYTKGKNILEIGVGRGALIATAIEMGYPIDCVEIEEDVAQNIADLLQHPVICCDFLDLPEEKTYDIISMGDVIEHLDDPRKGLEKARRLLKEDGVIWISTPNYNSAFNQLNRNRTAMWDEPWHITYFSREGLEKLLSEVGFDVLDYRISNHYNGSMEMIVQKKKN